MTRNQRTSRESQGRLGSCHTWEAVFWRTPEGQEEPSIWTVLQDSLVALQTFQRCQRCVPGLDWSLSKSPSDTRESAPVGFAVCSGLRKSGGGGGGAGELPSALPTPRASYHHSWLMSGKEGHQVKKQKACGDPRSHLEGWRGAGGERKEGNAMCRRF